MDSTKEPATVEGLMTLVDAALHRMGQIADADVGYIPKMPKERAEIHAYAERLSARESAEGGEAASHYEQQQWRGKLFNLMQYWHSTRDGATSKAEAWNAIWSHVQNMGPGWRTREYLAASGEAKRGAEAKGVRASEAPSLHQRIMNIPCEVPDTEAGSKHHAIWASGYKVGHRDARHAAAELVAAPPTGVWDGKCKRCGKTVMEHQPDMRCTAGGEAGGMAEANLPELPEAVAHVHSNGEVCMDRRVESGVWPVELVTLKQAHAYARAYAERLAVDARRYQRLRECDPADGGPCVMTHEMNDWGRWYFLPLLGEQLDAAIDAALSNKETPNAG